MPDIPTTSQELVGQSPMPSLETLQYMAQEMQAGRLQLTRENVAQMDPKDVQTLFALQKQQPYEPLGDAHALFRIGSLTISPEDLLGLKAGWGAANAGMGLGARVRAAAEAMNEGKGFWAGMGRAILHQPEAEAAMTTTGLSKTDQLMLDQISARNATIAGREAAAKSTLRSPLPTAPPAMPPPEGTTASFTGSRLKAPQTPMQELMQKGQFGGDRTTGTFPQGPGGLSNVTPPAPSPPTPPFNPPRMTLADEPPPAAAARLRSLAKTADPALMDEIQQVSRAYNEAKAAGDTVRARGLGKQLQELDRLGRGGSPFTPSTDEIVTTTPGVPPSKTIMNARLQAKLRKPKP